MHIVSSHGIGSVCFSPVIFSREVTMLVQTRDRRSKGARNTSRENYIEIFSSISLALTGSASNGAREICTIPQKVLKIAIRPFCNPHQCLCICANNLHSNSQTMLRTSGFEIFINLWTIAMNLKFSNFLWNTWRNTRFIILKSKFWTSTFFLSWMKYLKPNHLFFMQTGGFLALKRALSTRFFERSKKSEKHSNGNSILVFFNAFQMAFTWGQGMVIPARIQDSLVFFLLKKVFYFKISFASKIRLLFSKKIFGFGVLI